MVFFKRGLKGVAMLEGILYKVRIFTDGKLVPDIFAMVVDGMNADKKQLGDFFAGFPIGD